ncbi:MAG: RNA-binding S4 domain-containing protein [Burkholderiaceae bacterium]|nr:RNA-binding S4 domain-containing protein [Pseudomonadota bacterium]MBS0597212.1 RNA-binding S4 domain-containing protein [Pseudomonadota bacterium]MCO5115754.1 RNA-binding S4 domain-containing protein [Burkholderiaceae bacterium]MCP5219634.1 RNA-binding S4 domain-containing protein [Burkholderiaceae bacterium]
MTEPLERQRIDKWLWAARFFKTRALAVQAIERARVQVGGSPVKPARELKVGDLLRVRQGELEREVRVLALSALRGPAPVAQQLYAETAVSVAAREQAAAARRLAPEPARSIAQGRPTKRERRALDGQRRADWDQRWSAAWDE